MPANEKHAEFHAPELNGGREVPAGYDEENRRSARARLLRFQPGVYTTRPFSHEYREEACLISGDLTVDNDETGKGGKSFRPDTCACRPPHAAHGPVKSVKGCALLEIHYFDPA